MWHNKQEREGGKGPAAIRSKGKAGLKDSTAAQLQGADAAAAAVTPWPWDTKLLLHLPEQKVKGEPQAGKGKKKLLLLPQRGMRCRAKPLCWAQGESWLCRTAQGTGWALCPHKARLWLGSIILVSPAIWACPTNLN